MSHVSEEEKRVIVELIECWKEYVCLWDIQHDSYSNRDRRNEAYSSLLEIYKKISPEATIAALKKKLENMRSAYKREVRKVTSSETTGSGADQIYTPKLWYFDLLTFLGEKTCVTGGTETLEEDSANDTMETVNVEPGAGEVEGSPLTDTQMAPSQQRKRLRTSLEQKKESLINMAQTFLTTKEDKWELIGRSMGVQLKDLNADQQVIAQKLMADVIFYGMRGRLTDFTSINLNPQQVPQPFVNFPQHFPSPSPYNQNPYSSTPSPSYNQHPYSTTPPVSVMTPSHVSTSVVPNIEKQTSELFEL